MENKKNEVLSFEQAIKESSDIASSFCIGVQALKANSVVIQAKNTRNINGSVDIDSAIKNIYPQDSRWDYVVGYEEQAYFVEVHPANTSNVNEMINKKQWLENWLNARAPKLKSIKAEVPYYWVPSGKMAILRNSPQYRKIAKNHIKIVNKVILE